MTITRGLFIRINKLESFKILKSSERNSAVDVFRAFAIIVVVLYHYKDILPLGYLGVDLFFVISGLLVGGLLTKKFVNGERINFFKFFLQRGFKIWPSYYVFLIVGTLIAFLLYRNLSPDQIIPLWDFKRYLFFYQNYTGQPFHWSFDHVWSLCVEEHFYIILPVSFIIIQRLFNKKEVLFCFVGLVVIMGIVFKLLSLWYTHSKNTYSGTHVRIDALAWGVLLNLIVVYYPQLLKRKHIFLVSVLGFLLGIIAIAVFYNTDWIYYKEVIFHSLIPVCFFLMIAGLYYYDLSRLKVLRFIAYYSYNWYLWHPLFVIFLRHNIGNDIAGTVSYLGISFFLAVFFTVLVEEPFLKWRKHAIGGLFKGELKLSKKKTEA